MTDLLIPLDAIELLPMTGRMRLGPSGISPDRLIFILQNIVSGVKEYPVEVIKTDAGYQLYHGAHRYHASVALGFTHIPAVVRTKL